MSLFECKNCNIRQSINKYTVTVRNNHLVNVCTDTKEEICCPKCKKPLVFVEEKKDLSEVGFGMFSSKSIEEKQASLKKRSREDAKKQKYVENEREKVFYKG